MYSSRSNDPLSSSSSVVPRLLHLGHTLENKEPRGDREFTVDSAWLTRSAVIVGKSGTGKSYDVALIVSQLAQQGYSVVLLDRVGEHAQVLRDIPFVKVVTPGRDAFFHVLHPSRPSSMSDPEEAVEDILDTIAHYFAVSFGDRPTPLQQRIIREILLTYFGYSRKELSPAAPASLSIKDFIILIRRYEEFQKHVKGFTESCESIISRLYPLTVGTVGATFDTSRPPLKDEALFAPGAHVFDLSRLVYEPAKDLVCQLLVKRLYHAARSGGKTDGLRQLVAVDEAHHIAPRQPNDPTSFSFLEMMTIENRKFGQGVLAASTSPSQLSETLVRNSSIRICHLLDDSKDIDFVLRFMVNRLELENFITDIRCLAVGEAVVSVSSPVSIRPTRLKVTMSGSP